MYSFKDAFFGFTCYLLVKWNLSYFKKCDSFVSQKNNLNRVYCD